MAKTEPISGAVAFLDHLGKSALLAPDATQELRKSALAEADAASIARQLVKEGKLTKWQAQQLLFGYSRLTVGKYRLLDQIGKGPMGRVYLAEHGKLNKKVSLKLLSSRLGSQPEMLKRFLDEANRAGALNHRNIVHIFDVGQDDDGSPSTSAQPRYYLAMEYVEGKDLQRLVEAGGPMPAAQANDLARQAAEGLAHAHEQNLTHGDLKPSNLLVDGNGVLKILDLGLSGLADSSTAGGAGDESAEAPSLASLAFRAPELLAASRRSDVRSDLYSLGAILYFLLTGKPPVPTENDIADSLLKVPGVVPELANVCDHLLASNPQERPESAAHVVAALELAARAKSGAEKASAKPESERPYSAGKPKRPLVARPLEEPSGAVAVVSQDEINAGNDNALAGFSIKTGRKRRVAAQPAASTTPAPTAKTTPTSGSKSRLPLILGAAIGGGVLVIGAIVTIVVILASRGGTPQQVAIARQPTAAAKSAATTTAKDSKKDSGGESNPESNSAAVTETNPASETTDSKTPVPSDAGAKGEPRKSTTTTPAKGSDQPPGAKDSKGTTAAPTTEIPASPPPTTTPATTAPPTTPKPSETKTEPAKAPTPATAPAPTPPPTPAVNPFQGFAAAIALPPLEAMGKPVADALAPAALGPVKLEPTALCIIKLKGGETAYKGKNKFLLEPASQGTAERDWEFKLQSDNDPPLVIATLSIKDDQLVFQWTEAATKQQAAPYLCNSVLSLSAGAGSHQVALRKPLVVEPLVAEVEKGAINEKFNLDYPPGGKQITVEFGPLIGGPPKHKVDPKTELEAFKDTTYLFAGNADDALLLGFKIDVSMPGKTLSILALPQYMLTGMAKPDRYLKATAGKLGNATSGEILAAQNYGRLAAAHPNAEQKKQMETAAKGQLERAQKNMAQIEQLKDVAKALQAGAKIHFRAHYLADDAKVELINTGAAPPAAAPMPMPATK